jgi:hypothetical protein
MRQVIHIFRKDVRQHWPEVLFTLAVLVAFMWDEPRHWILRDDFGLSHERWIPILLVLSWWLLIVRTVQSEALVGDRQYWITRPYDWKKLLAAKILFVAAFVTAPLFISYAFLLAKAGFRPLPSFVPWLLWMHVELVMLLLLPIAALATVTSTIAQMVLTVLAVGLYMAGAATLAAYVPSEGFSSGSDGVQAAVLIGACIATVVWQYSRRKTNHSRAILAAAAGAIIMIIVATPYRTLVSFQYPQLNPGERQPVQLALIPAMPPGVMPSGDKDLQIQVPIRVSGISEGSFVGLDGTMLTMEAPDGLTWNSGWQSNPQLLYPHQELLQLNFEAKRSFLERVKATAVRFHISFALTVWRDKGPTRISAAKGDFELPGVGLCSIDRIDSTSLLCRFPVRGPSLVVVETPWSDADCSILRDELVPGTKTARGWAGNSESGPFSPVGTFHLYLWMWDGMTISSHNMRICPGYTLFFSVPEEVRRVGIEVDWKEIRLADYEKSDPLRDLLKPHPGADPQ